MAADLNVPPHRRQCDGGARSSWHVRPADVLVNKLVIDTYAITYAVESIVVP